MVDATINSNVGVNINPAGMEGSIAKINAQVEKFIAQINKAGAATNQQLKALAITARNLQTVGNFNAQNTLGGFGNLQTLGRQARALAEYQAGFSKTANAAGVLRNRLQQLDVANGKLLQTGKTPPKDSLLRAESLERTATAYNKATNQVTALRGRIALLGEDGRKAFAPMLANIDQLDKKNQALFGRQNRFSFTPQVEQMQRAVAALTQQVGLTEKAKANDAARLQMLRQQGQQLLTNNQYEALSARAAAVRQGGSILRNASLTGTPLYQRELDQTERLRRAQNLLVSTNAKLSAELAKPNPGAARLDALINRHRTLQREIGMTIARQHQFDVAGAKSGGFMAGLKHSRMNLFGEGETGMFGAGALVGRVAAYAVAASAIYGIISAMREAISFSIQYEDALAQLQGVSGATTMEMERLSEGILKVSRNSSSSVIELTKAATIIAQAGYGGSEIEGMLQAVTALADASGSTAAESVDILTSALGSFQLGADEAMRVTNALVATLNESKLSVNQVQLGLQYVGATARQNNISLNELVGTLGAMADAGIRSGSTMSTGLRQMLIDFIDPSEKLLTQLEKIGLTTADIDVKTLGLSTVLQTLRDNGFQAYGALETRAAAAYAVLSSNIPQMERLTQASLQENAALDGQADRLDSVAAQWQIMLNTFAKIGAEIGENLSPLLKGLIEIFTLLGTAAFGVVQFFSEIIGALSRLTGEAQTASITVEEFQSKLRGLGVEQEDVVDLSDKLGDSFGDLETLTNDLAAEYDSLRTRSGSLREETNKLILRSDQLGASKAGVTNQLNLLASRFPGLRDEFRKTEGGIAGLITAMFNLDRQARATLATVAAAQRVAAQQQIDQANENAQGLISKANNRGKGFDRLRGSRVRSPEVQQFDQFVRNRQWQRAMDLATNSPEVRKVRGSDLETIRNFTTSYYSARNDLEIATVNQQQAEFLSSDAGSRLSNAAVRMSNVATLAASRKQGTDAALAGIEGNLKALDQLEASGTLDEGSLAGVGELRALLISSRAALLPDPVKDKAGSGRTRTPRERVSRAELSIQREETEYLKQLYDNVLQSIENAPTLEELPDLLADADDALTSWLQAEGDLALEQINTQKPTDAQRTRLLELAAKKADQMRVENVDKVADLLAKVIKEFIKRSTDAIERTFEESLREVDRNLQIQQGRLEGLNNPLESNNTPEYMKVVQQRRTDEAQDAFNRQQIIANDARIAEYQRLAVEIAVQRDELNRQIESLGKQRTQGSASPEEIVVIGRRLEAAKDSLSDLDDDLLKLNDDTLKLITTNQALKASYDVLNDVPRTFGDGMRMALEAVRLDIGAADSFGQDLIKNLDQPLRAVHESFKGFFSDMINGTTSLAGAFENMAGRIIDAIIEMVAVALANQFFSLMAGMFGPAAPSGFIAPLSASGGFGPGAWHGGQVGSPQVPIRNMYGGGAINGGVGTRDSTLIRAAKEEYIIRRPAAQSLGKGFLDAINARGIHALDGLGPQVAPVMQAPSVETNVYVIAPEEKPTMGPNDVIATISNDVLKGGVTRKLIKQVANNG